MENFTTIANSLRGSLKIDNGIGNSVTEITDPLTEVEYLRVVAGTGYDTLKFGNTQIGTIIADLHDGGSSTTLTNSPAVSVMPLKAFRWASIEVSSATLTLD